MDTDAKCRARAYRAELINRVLKPHRLALEDLQAYSFVIATATGKREIVYDLGGIWRQDGKIREDLGLRLTFKVLDGVAAQQAGY